MDFGPTNILNDFSSIKNKIYENQIKKNRIEIIHLGSFTN